MVCSSVRILFLTTLLIRLILSPSFGREREKQEKDNLVPLFSKRELSGCKFTDPLSTKWFHFGSYFLLRHLASLVGQEKFIDMLGKYVQQFHGQQVKSQDFLHFFFSTFKDAPAGQGGLQGKISMAEIMNEWLDKPGMPPKLEKFEVCRYPPWNIYPLFRRILLMQRLSNNFSCNL